MHDEARCSSCGAMPHLVTDSEDRPVRIEWRHAATCRRSESEDRRLSALAKRESNPAKGIVFTPATGTIRRR